MAVAVRKPLTRLAQVEPLIKVSPVAAAAQQTRQPLAVAALEGPGAMQAEVLADPLVLEFLLVLPEAPSPELLVAEAQTRGKVTHWMAPPIQATAQEDHIRESLVFPLLAALES